MIEECPVNFESRIVHSIERPVHTIFIGEIKEVYFNENCLTDGSPDISKIDPILFSPNLGTKVSTKKFSGSYWRLGAYLTEAWNIGKELKS